LGERRTEVRREKEKAGHDLLIGPLARKKEGEGSLLIFSSFPRGGKEKGGRSVGSPAPFSFLRSDGRKEGRGGDLYLPLREMGRGKRSRGDRGHCPAVVGYWLR